MKITILGGGVWGKALYTLASRNQEHQVYLWSRNSGISLASVVKEAQVIMIAVAMKGVRPTREKLLELSLAENVILVSATKGLDQLTNSTPGSLWEQAFPQSPIVVVSGPNLSVEIEQGLPAATVVASKNVQGALIVQSILASETFRVYVNKDPLGTELGGILKNVMAIAAGVCDGLKLGANAKAGLLTRALPEMIRIGSSLGAVPETFFGLSGLGDLLATSFSHLSRNYQVGYQLAQGLSLETILANIQGTAEGVYTTDVLVDLAMKQGIAVPITYQVYRLLHEQTTPLAAVQALMERELKTEFY